MYKNILILPTYLPSLLNAAAMVQCKTLIVETKDNFNKQSLRNRAYIHTASGPLSLSIPVKHNKKKGHKKTETTRIENDFPWQRQHWRSIQIAYRSSPYFEFYEERLSVLYDRTYTHLMDYNLKCNALIIDLLKINPEVEKTIVYDKKPLITDLRSLVDAKKNYNLDLPKYIQVFEQPTPIDPKLAVIDLIFSEGPNAVDYLRKIDLSQIGSI